MKQIEITVRVEDEFEKIVNILAQNGFSKLRVSRVEDKYLSQSYASLEENNFIDILSSCVLLRYLKVNSDSSEKVFKKITYKNKKYLNNHVISEEKINVNCDDLEEAEKLFNCLGYKKIVDVNYDVIVYSKDDVELAFQNVEGLGMLLEYENNKDFSLATDDEILEAKKRMWDYINSLGINIAKDYDVKKAYELLKLNKNSRLNYAIDSNCVQ